MDVVCFVQLLVLDGKERETCHLCDQGTELLIDRTLVWEEDAHRDLFLSITARLWCRPSTA